MEMLTRVLANDDDDDDVTCVAKIYMVSGWYEMLTCGTDNRNKLC